MLICPMKCNFVSVLCPYFLYSLVTCSSLESPINGRMLGKMQFPGHEVHFLCDAGFVLVGSETRQCKDSLRWSGQQPVCKGAKIIYIIFCYLLTGYFHKDEIQQIHITL